MTNHKLVAIAVGPDRYRLALAHENPAVMDYILVDYLIYPDVINGRSESGLTTNLADAYAFIRQFERGMVYAVDSLGEEHANERSEAMATGLF